MRNAGDPRGLTSTILAHRAALADAVIAYADALDARDWTAFRGLFEDQIEVDYSSMGSLKGQMAADAWVDRCRALEGFDATCHKVANFAFDIGAGQTTARVSSTVDAAHFLHHQGHDFVAEAQGRYRHALRLRPDGWRITAVTFTVAGYVTGKASFEEAFAIVRAAHAARSQT